jgi:hypothetical protein
MKRWIALMLVVLSMAVVLALPVVAFAGGDQVQYGHPTTDMPYGGAGDRTGGDWGNPSNNG